MALSTRVEFRRRALAAWVPAVLLVSCVLGGVVLWKVVGSTMGPVFAAVGLVWDVMIGVALFVFMRTMAARQARQRIAIDPPAGLFTLYHFSLMRPGKPALSEEQVTLGFDEVQAVEPQHGGTVVKTARGEFHINTSWINYEELVGIFREMVQ